MFPPSVWAIVAAVVLVAVPPPVLDAAMGPSPVARQPAVVASLTTDAVPVPTGSSVAPLDAGTSMRLAFTLAFSNASRLARVLSELSGPSPGGAHGDLSFSQVMREFGPSPSAALAVEEALRSAGASSVVLAPGGLAVDATLTAASVEHLLGVRLVRFDAPGVGPGYTAVGSPTFPGALLGDVVGIDGLAATEAALVDRPSLTELAPPLPVPTGAGQFIQGNSSSGADWFLGSDFAQAYEATELLPGNSSVLHATYPSKVAIATLLASGYNATNSTTLPPWAPSVVDRYFNNTFPAGWPLPVLRGVPVNEAGAPLPPPPGSFHGENDSSGYETENSLDLEMAGSMAPGSLLVNFYVSGSLLANPVTWANSPQYLADDLGAALSYNYSPAHLVVISCSFGLADLNDSQWDTELAVAAAMNVTVVAASGDQGDAPDQLTGLDQGPWPLWPATASFNDSGAISVGGATVSLAGSPTGTYVRPPLVVQYDADVEGIANATTWWDGTGGVGRVVGTEGGTSQIYPEPSWQFHSAAQPAIVNATVRERFDGLGRAGPDVALAANDTIAYVSANLAGTVEFAVLEGTSIAAPLFAGLLADIVAVEGAPTGKVVGLGFLDPELYRIASYYQAYPGSSDPFLDVLYGSNALFSAGPGWDATTGWGEVSAPLLLAALEDPAVANYTYTGPTPTLPGSSSPGISLLTVAVIASAAGMVIVAASWLLVSRQQRAALGPGTAGSYSPSGGELPPGGAVATFSCPTCGAERPAEPGRCPSCGAM